mmetsp:Transcript_78139/g.95687  ORF Transcript_78139/g.95687 Transcript_78139/m.95687 type:complete len:179 (-) Transcript_78139:188-724(-)
MARSNSVFAFKNLQAIDKLTLSIVGGVYLLLLWLPVMVSLYLLCTTGNNEEFKHKKWLWKWKKQWVYVETWCRTSVIFLIALLMIVFFEDFPDWFRIAVPILQIIQIVILHFCAKTIRGRIPGSKEFTSLMNEMISLRTEASIKLSKKRKKNKTTKRKKSVEMNILDETVSTQRGHPS